MQMCSVAIEMVLKMVEMGKDFSVEFSFDSVIFMNK